MSLVTEHGGKGYAPLPQSMSNTDTENEEDEVAGRGYSPKKHSHQSAKHESTIIQENGRFYPLDETKNLANRTRNGRSNINLALGYCSDDIPIMVVDQDQNDDLWKRPHMSLIRQFFLVASILLCLATILIFLYVLPCGDYDDVQVPSIKNREALLWDNTLKRIELYGPISVVPGTPSNLIFMFRDQLYGEATETAHGPKIPKGGGGVISIHGGNGSPQWWVTMYRVPTEIDCGTLDVDGRGKPDCLVAGEQGLLMSIEPVAGTVRWSSDGTKTHSKLPVFMPDIDEDGTDDLLSVEIADANVPGLALISGKTGHLLGHLLRPDCRRIRIYSVELNATISYLCHDSNGKQSTRSVPLAELYNATDVTRVKKRLAVKLGGLPKPFIIQERDSEQVSLGLSPFHQLAIQRQGSCPGYDCLTTMNVTFQGSRTNESRLIWSSSGPNTYGTEPAILGDPKSSVTGFVIKFWQCNAPDVRVDETDSSDLRRTITEWTLVVIINQTQVHAANASQTEITQICRARQCQPSLKLQRQSLVVAELNDDRSRELISYQTSYELGPRGQVLQSKIQVVRIDAEVAKLTQTIAA